MTPLRPAGFNERRCIARDVHGLYGSMISCATYTTTSNEPIALESGDFFKALKHGIVEHPALSAVIQESETETPLVARPPTVDLSKHLHILPEYTVIDNDQTESIRSLLEHAHNVQFTDRHARPPWLVFVQPIKPHASLHAKSFQLAFSCSHALLDGYSTLLFHDTFLRSWCSLPGDQNDSKTIVDLSSITGALPPPLEQVAKLPITWSFLLGPLLGEYLPTFLARMLGVAAGTLNEDWTGPAQRPVRPTGTALLNTAVQTKLIPAIQLQGALDACRKHQARLTGILELLVARGLSARLQSRDIEATQFGVQTPIDLRRLLPPGTSTKVMANWVSGTSDTIALSSAQNQTPHELGDEDWRIACALTEHQQRAASTLTDQPIGLLKYLSNYHEWTLRKAAKPAEKSFEVSNVGVFNSEVTDATWQIESMVFSQSANATDCPFSVNVASVRGGALALTVTWWPGMLGVQDEDVFVCELLDDVQKTIPRLQ